MEQAVLKNLIDFFKETELIKKQNRTAWLSNGEKESIAEHSWRMSLIAICLASFVKELDIGKLLKMCIIHDLGEAYEGDIPAIEDEDYDIKLNREKFCLNKLLGKLPDHLSEEISCLWNEYCDGKTAEAKYAKGIDKIETIIQHIQGDNPADFNYAYNLQYGKEYTSDIDILLEIRAVVDLETEQKMRLTSD